MKWALEQTDDRPDLTPMIDIIFLLIVFFMTVANIVTSERVEIDVPIADQAQVPENQQFRETVTIDEEGNLFLGAREVTLGELQNVVTAGVQGSPQYQVLLRVDAVTEYRFTREVMSACAEVGAINIIFTTYQSEV